MYRLTSISICNAVRVGATFAAWVLLGFLAYAVVAGLVLAAVNVVAWIGRFALAVDLRKAFWAFTHAQLVAEFYPVKI